MIYHDSKSALFSEKEKKIIKPKDAIPKKIRTIPCALNSQFDRKQRFKSIKDWLYK